MRNLTELARRMINIIMPKQSHGTQTMTQLLRNSLAKAQSVRAVAKATGVLGLVSKWPTKPATRCRR